MISPVIKRFAVNIQAHVTQVMFAVNITCVIIALFLFSCSSGTITRQGIASGEEHVALPLRFSMIFIIHGDGNYLYHDSNGIAHRADEEALAAATKVAKRNPQAEVFIFHERRREHTLFFFPRRDGSFYHYRHGRLLVKESYWRDHGSSRFDSVVERYMRYRKAEQSEMVKIFLYFGHEIPEIDGAGYDASYSHRTFTIDDLTDGLNGITPDSARLDLIVLSTCFNGTPHTIARLAPYVRTVVASPDNLHLSYLDVEPFERLDAGLQDGNVMAFATNFARHAFNRLTEDIQTAVTVAVYDVDSVQTYLQAVGKSYNHTLAAIKTQQPESLEHCDCADEAIYVTPEIGEGVTIFYRAPGFGRTKHKRNHSGWGCWRLRQ